MVATVLGDLQKLWKAVQLAIEYLVDCALLSGENRLRLGL